MSQAKDGDTVKVAYVGTLEDGSVFDKSQGENYLEFTLGAQQMIPGFEKAVNGMDLDETKTVKVPSSEAYGEYDNEAVVEVSRSRLPDNLEPEVGQRLQAQSEGGSPIAVTVTDIGDNTIKLDANHPLAGKELTFEITLKEIAG